MLVVFVSNESGVRHIHGDLHVTKVVHLLLVIRLTLWMHIISNVAKLCVLIIAGQKNKLPSLIVVVI